MADSIEAAVEAARVAVRLVALGYDRVAILQVQQQIADLHLTSSLSWREATVQVLARCGPAPETGS